MARTSSINVRVLRRRIDALDAQLVRLLNERMRLGMRIGDLKKARGAALYDPVREKEVLARLARINRGPLSDAALAKIYRAIMAATLTLECDYLVAYPARHSRAARRAASLRFGPGIRCVNCRDMADTCRAVQFGRAEYGLVPVEEVLVGPHIKALERAIEAGLQVCSVVTFQQSNSGAASSPFLVIERAKARRSGRKKTLVLVRIERNKRLKDEASRALRRAGWSIVATSDSGLQRRFRILAVRAGVRHSSVVPRRRGLWATVLGTCPV